MNHPRRLLAILSEQLASELTIITNIAAQAGLEPWHVAEVRGAVARSQIVLESLREAV